MVVKIYWLEPVLIAQFKLKYSAPFGLLRADPNNNKKRRRFFKIEIGFSPVDMMEMMITKGEPKRQPSQLT